MRRCAGIALVVGWVVLVGVASAQRGGGHAVVGGAARGSIGGGRSASAGFGFSGSRAPATAYHPSYASRSGVMGVRSGVSAVRPSFYGNRGGGAVRARVGVHSYYPGYGVYPYPYGWGGDGFLQDDGNAGYQSSGYGLVDQPDGVMPPPPRQADVSPSHAAAPVPEDAVTLIFKDGRPPLQIHNYALTRTTLYVTDARHREIAVADLDLAATERVNADAGVSFALPGQP